MTVYISLLRGINVSGQKKIRMAELKTLYEEVDLHNVETYIQSGNVIFASPEDDIISLAARIEDKIEQSLGYQVTVQIRDREDCRRIAHSNPFLTTRSEDPAKLHVTFLAAVPSAAKVDQLETPPNSRDEFQILGREVYLFCPNGYGRTKLSNNFFERKLDVAATTRNWRTIMKLLEMAEKR